MRAGFGARYSLASFHLSWCSHLANSIHSCIVIGLAVVDISPAMCVSVHVDAMYTPFNCGTCIGLIMLGGGPLFVWLKSLCVVFCEQPIIKFFFKWSDICQAILVVGRTYAEQGLT